MSRVEENTLGVIVGRENLARRSRSFRRPERTVSTTRANQDALGGRHLTVATLTAAALISAFLLALFLLQLVNMRSPLLSASAWALLAIVITASAIIVRSVGMRVPTWLFLGGLVLGVVVIALDIVGTWGQTGDYVTPTAALAVPALLVAVTTMRETAQIIVADAILGAVLLFAAAIEERRNTETIAAEMLMIAIAIGPPLLGVAIVRTYRRMVQLELDLALVQSTVQAPRLAVGMLASEELTRLDDDAERLLDDVAEGRVDLPLPPESSQRAGALATALRLHLIEGRKETWLRHAVAESEFLAPSVTIDDPSSLAGMLNPDQRDALLLVIWLLVSDADRWGATVHLIFGPARPPVVGAYRTVQFPIVLETTGVPRRRVDAAAWEALRVVGPHIDTVRDGSLRVEIECSAESTPDP